MNYEQTENGNRKQRKKALKKANRRYSVGCDAPRRGEPVPRTGKVPASSSRRGGR